MTKKEEIYTSYVNQVCEGRIYNKNRECSKKIRERQKDKE
jgi:hypothetical protein